MISTLLPLRFLVPLAVLFTLAVLPAEAVVIIQDDFNYTDTNLQGNSPNVVNLAGTTFEGRISTYNNIQTNGSIARADTDQNNGIGISTGSYAGSISRISADLIVTNFGTAAPPRAVMGVGFWTTFPYNTGSSGGTFSGFRFTSGAAGNLAFVVNGSTLQTVAIDFSSLALNTPYNMSYDINADGSFSNLVFNGTDYTSVFTVSSLGAFSGTRTNYAGAVIAGGANARGAWDNLIVEAVPESGSGILLLLGTAAFGLVRRRGNQRVAA